MNLRLDLLIRSTVRDPGLLDRARTAPSAVAHEAGVPMRELGLVLAGDLAGLYRADVNPVLIMHLAAALGIDPMQRLREVAATE
jgi:hypothetical protein